MIVKNEERVLKRCLDSLADLMDEIIIVDTGSTDKTKEIAQKYTDKIYDFEWINDFSAARNFAFSKASCEYIYTADADEMLDKENKKRLAVLKEAMLPEIEIVQMHYLTRTEFNTTQNFMDEYRPKLYKRLREFTWIYPVHEIVRLDPVVFDSDIEILHLPESLHSKRDFSIFHKEFSENGILAPHLFSMFAKELYISGSDEDFIQALPVTEGMYHLAMDESENAVAITMDTYQEILCLLAHTYRITENIAAFEQITEAALSACPCSEIHYELGLFYKTHGVTDMSDEHFYNAAHETVPCIDLRTGQ